MQPAYYFIGLVIIAAALLYVGWLLWDEKRKESAQNLPEQTASAPKEPSTTPQSLLERLGLKKGSSSQNPETQSKEAGDKPKIPFAFSFPNMKGKLSFLNKAAKTPSPAPHDEKQGGGGVKSLLNRFSTLLNKQKPPKPIEEGTASLRLNQLNLPETEIDEPSPPTIETHTNRPAEAYAPDQTISAESELSLQVDEWQTKHQELNEKYQKIESLLTEKSQELEKTEKTLVNERKTHKEFNKLKDILEKELKDTRDKSRQLQNDLANAQAEIQVHIKRITQLEEKVKTLEKDVLQKDDQNKNLQIDRQKYQNQLKELEETVRHKDTKIEGLVNSIKQEKNNVSVEPSVISSPIHQIAKPVSDTPSPVIESQPAPEPSSQPEPPQNISFAEIPAIENKSSDKKELPEQKEPVSPESLPPQSEESSTSPDNSDSSDPKSESARPKLAPDILTNTTPKIEQPAESDNPSAPKDETQGTTDKQS